MSSTVKPNLITLAACRLITAGIMNRSLHPVTHRQAAVDQRDVRDVATTGGSFGVVFFVFAVRLPGGWPCSNPKIHHAI